MAIVQKLGKEEKMEPGQGQNLKMKYRWGHEVQMGLLEMCLVSALGSFLLMLALRLSAVTIGAGV